MKRVGLLFKDQGKNACKHRCPLFHVMLQYSLCKPSEKILETNYENDYV